MHPGALALYRGGWGLAPGRYGLRTFGRGSGAPPQLQDRMPGCRKQAAGEFSWLNKNCCQRIEVLTWIDSLLWGASLPSPGTR